MPELEVETPGGAPAGAKPAKKKKSAKKKSLLPPVRIAPQAAIEPGADILFKVKRLHGYHGTVLEVVGMDVNADGTSILCRVNEEALEGELVTFRADQLVLVKHPNELKAHSSDRLKYDYKD